jgi:hypothetical protein
MTLGPHGLRFFLDFPQNFPVGQVLWLQNNPSCDGHGRYLSLILSLGSSHLV